MSLYGWETLIVGYYNTNHGGYRHCGSEDRTVFACHVISEDHEVKSFILLYGLEPRMVSHHSSKFGGQRYCGSGAISFLVTEEQDSTSCLNLPLLFIPTAHDMACSHTQISEHRHVQAWSRMPRLTIEKKYRNKFCHSVHISCEEKENKKSMTTQSFAFWTYNSFNRKSKYREKDSLKNCFIMNIFLYWFMKARILQHK